MLSRRLLATRRQQSSEALDAYLNALRLSAKDFNFRAVTAEVYKQEMIRDFFINGFSSNHIRHWLLENTTLTLEAAFTQARSLESAQVSSEHFNDGINANAAFHAIGSPNAAPHAIGSPNAVNKSWKCFFCGSVKRHLRNNCPAKGATCNNCGRLGHFAKVCKSISSHSQAAAVSSLSYPQLAAVRSASINNLSKAIVHAQVKNANMLTLIDTGSSISFIRKECVSKLKLEILPVSTTISVSMADSSCSSPIVGKWVVNLKYLDNEYTNAPLFVMDTLCTELIIGQEILNQHDSLKMYFGGKKPVLTVCGLANLNDTPSSLFSNIDPACKPIAVKSRRYNHLDKKFIDAEVQRLLMDDIIEPSTSPWRAQVVVVSDETPKKRMVVDYSTTTNKFTYLDAQYKVFSNIDIKDAYYQVPIVETDKQYTAFEAGGKLYQYKRIPFGVTNGVSCFQRKMDKMIDEYNIKDTFAYLDNIIICGETQGGHDNNLAMFNKMRAEKNITVIEDKSVYSLSSVKHCDYYISNGGNKA